MKTRPAAVRAKGPPAKLSRLIATPLPKTTPKSPLRGRLHAGQTSFPCAFGTSLSRRKCEGDLATPTGRFRLVGGFFRPMGARPAAAWPLRTLQEMDGWCDDAQAPFYNRPVRLPSPYSCEKLWRNDGLYDLVLILGYNLWPRRKGKGSAIFLHCARDDFAATAGCVALRQADLRRLLPRLSAKAALTIR